MPGCRSLADVLAAGHHLEINKDSPQARGLRCLFTPSIGAGGKLREILRRKDGTFTNGATIRPSNQGRAIFFDGSNDHVVCADGVTPTGPYTLAAWVRLTTYQSNPSGPDWDMRTVLNAASGTYSDLHGMFVNGSGALVSNVNWHGGIAAGERSSISGGSVALGAWVHLVTLYDGLANRAFVNGQQVASEVKTFTVRATDAANIGKFASGSLGGYWDGLIGELRCYEGGLSAGQVFQLYDPETRFDVYWRRRRSAPKAPAPSGAIAGAAAGAATVSGTLTGTGALAGASAGAATCQVTATGNGACAGAAAGVATVTATLTAAGAMAGSSAGTATVAGSLGSESPIAGSCAGAASCSGTVTGNGSLSATDAGVATVTAVLLATGALAGSSAGTSTASLQNGVAASTESGSIRISVAQARLRLVRTRIRVERPDV